ncbi:MAG: hypothetical protein AB7R89_08185 [Dehalococcoidia bacterium]
MGVKGNARENAEGAYAGRLNHWLRHEVGAEEPRRVVSRSNDRVLVSKFAAGFAEHLRESLDHRADLFDPGAVATAYARQVARAPDIPKVEVWRLAMSEMLADRNGTYPLSPAQQAEVQAGVDSVAAVLASVIWSAPTAGEPFRPQTGEREAYRDALARLGSTAGPFTRRYGVFDGAQVVNHCPGAPYARMLLALGWLVCTGTEPPALDDAEHLTPSQ